MRVWIDLTNSPHVLVLRPAIELLRADGHDVRVTARDFAQTLQLLERFGIEHEAIGRHRGGRLGAKGVGLVARSAALVRWARAQGPARPGSARPFDLALGHGSNDVSIAARLLGVPCATMFDYEWAAVQHHLNCRLCQAVVVPDAIPPERLARYGARGKLRPYEGLKEEYYLADFEADPAVLDELGLQRSRPIVVVRTPPAVSLYHRFENDLFAEVLARLREAAARGEGDGVQAVVLPRTAEQARAIASASEPERQRGRVTGRAPKARAGQGEPGTTLNGAPGLIVPARAIDAQSLIAYADLVVSAGGTMNREAVALGTPVYTTFEGRLGAVDERLIAEGRLRRLHSAAELDLAKRASASVSEGERRGERASASGSPRPHDERGAERSEGAEPGAPPPSSFTTTPPFPPSPSPGAPGGSAADPSAGAATRVRRDPRRLLELLLSPLASEGTP
jgi:uncharacterized protein